MMAMLGRRRGTNWFVDSSTGSNSNTGKSLAQAWADPHYAANQDIKPGDVVIVYPGSGYISGGTFIDEPNSGTATNWVTFTAAAGTTPVFHTTSTSTGAADHANVVIYPLSYQVIQGFSITSTGTGQTDAVECGYYTNSPLFHHFVIRNLIVSGMNADGILFNSCDYATVSGCTIVGCGSGDSGGPAGIHLFSFSAYDNYTGYHNKIIGNVLFNNIQESGTIIDGEGIIIDDFNGDQDGYAPYTGSTQITNNLCYYNGSTGILVYDSSYVDIYMNTCYFNQRNLGGGEIACNGTVSAVTHIHIYNNIVYPSGSNKQIYSVNATGVTSNYNCRYSGTVNVTGSNDVTTNPQFIAPGIVLTSNFQLSGNSPCINVGSSAYAINFDLLGVVRPQSTNYDLGCYEYV